MRWRGAKKIQARARKLEFSQWPWKMKTLVTASLIIQRDITRGWKTLSLWRRLALMSTLQVVAFHYGLKYITEGEMTDEDSQKTD